MSNFLAGIELRRVGLVSPTAFLRLLNKESLRWKVNYEFQFTISSNSIIKDIICQELDDPYSSIRAMYGLRASCGSVTSELPRLFLLGIKPSLKFSDTDHPLPPIEKEC